MNREIDILLSHPFMETLAFFSVTLLALILFLAVFEWVTAYNAWDEIRHGNLAVAMSVGGKIFGICNIFRFAIEREESIYASLVWACFGFVLLLAAYFIYEFLTPYFKIDEEIQNRNTAVGFISMVISVSLSYVIGASVN
jgi:putative membrane protein